MLLLLAVFACKDPIPRPDAQDSADTEIEFEAPDYLAGIDCGPDAIDSTADPATLGSLGRDAVAAEGCGAGEGDEEKARPFQSKKSF